MIGRDLTARAQQLSAQRAPFVLVTVVRVEHPTSSTPGDSALVLAGGAIEGFVGGVCAQASVRLHAARALETGRAVLLRITPGDPGAGQAGAILHEAEGIVIENNPCLSGGTMDLFLDPQLPPPRVVVVGETPIARALERVGAAAGFDVMRCSPGAAAAGAGDAGVIVASHGDGEEGALAAALLARVPYVALVSSEARGAAVVAALDVPDELRAQVHAPAGLRLGGREPAEIAIAILAELIGERHAQAAAQPPVPGPQTARDPICGMEVLVSDASIQLDAGGEVVYFCGEGCRAAYVALHAGDAV